MTTFDAWEGLIRPSNDYLAHHGIRGMKHGRNRYQNPDGSWTEEGLARRKKREGWGEKRAERKAARAERKKERQEKRAEQKAAYKEAQRKSKAKTMTTEELKEQIERLKLENEYRELKKSPLLKTGEKLVTDYLQNKHAKAERAYNDKQTKLAREQEMAKLKEQTEQTKIKSEADKERAKADAERAKADKTRADTDRIDIEKGTRMVKLKNEGKNLKLQNKRYISDYTIRGGAKKMINKILSGRGDAVGATWRGASDANIAVTQARKVNRYNKRHKGEAQAAVPEGGFDYGNSNSSGNNEKKKKKGKT